jgi:hypothetical protein
MTVEWEFLKKGQIPKGGGPTPEDAWLATIENSVVAITHDPKLSEDWTVMITDKRTIGPVVSLEIAKEHTIAEVQAMVEASILNMTAH